MKPHQQRVVDELTDLKVKVDKLLAFLDTSVFEGLEEDEKDRLQRQCHYMLGYRNVLEERIQAF